MQYAPTGSETARGEKGFIMKKFFINLLSFILYFNDKKARKKFRAGFNSNAQFCKKLRKRGILGANSYIVSSCHVADNNSRIGKFCSIARNVSIGTTTHPLDMLTTSPIPYFDIDNLTGGMVFPDENKVTFESKKPVFIGNDVWIGLNAVIMDGVKIGDGAVIGSGAIVTRDIPPYAIAVGVPAKVIKYRFPEETVNRLLKTRRWDQPEEVIAALPVNNVEKCLEILEAQAARSGK